MSMSKIYFGALVCAFVLAGFAGTASSQTVINARIVTACGTAPFPYNAGATGPVLIDVNGNLCTGAKGSTPTVPIFIVPGTATYTDTVKSLTAATDTTLLAATANLKSVCIMNIGLNPVTFTNGATAAVVGNGQALAPAAVAGQQGGGYCWPLPPSTAIHAISTGGSTVIVTVGQ